MDELIKAYDEYIQLLQESESALFPLAVSQGFRFPEKTVKIGKELRAKIKFLKEEYENQRVSKA